MIDFHIILKLAEQRGGACLRLLATRMWGGGAVDSWMDNPDNPGHSWGIRIRDAFSESASEQPGLPAFFAQMTLGP